MFRTSVPGGVRTLLLSRCGDRVVVDCRLRGPEPFSRPLGALVPGLVIRVRDIRSDGVVIELPDGTSVHVDAARAATVQVEPVDGPDRW